MKLQSRNPSQGWAVIGEVEASTEDNVTGATARARHAHGEWAATSVEERCRQLDSLLALVSQRAEEMAMLIAMETGRPIQSARSNVQGGIDYFTAYAAMAPQCLAPVEMARTDSDVHYLHRESWGVVACICPWNYPFMNVAWQCGQALLAGNTIVYKNSEENPLFTRMLAELLAESDLPNGVFNVLYGDGQVGDWMVHGDIDMISFTGSAQTGQLLATIAAQRFVPIVMELGGSSPALVFADAEIQAAAQSVASLRLINSGQACDAVKRVIVDAGRYEEFVAHLCNAMSSRVVGNALDEATEVGPMITPRHVGLLEEQVADAVRRGATVRIGGGRPGGLGDAFCLPTVVTDVTRDMRVWTEEVFGPILPVVPFVTEDEAISLANDTPYGLSAHVFTHDQGRFERAAGQLKAGSVAQNSVGYWSPEHPFGGYKKSGRGRIHGRLGFDDVTQSKVISAQI